jgi:NAD(P)-dependent dehydrogenase (short-subunit alcohol dehydrogenase family)
MEEEGQVAVVTGATGGLGRVVTRDLIGDGWRVAIIGSSAERLESMVSELGSEGQALHRAAADLRDLARTRAALDGVREHFGRIDAVVHLVGGWTGGTNVLDSPDDPYAAMLDQHLWTMLNVVRVAVPGMVAAGFGRLVAVSSPLVETPAAGMCAYAVGKAALEALVAGLAHEVAGSGVTANVLRVRAIDTEHVRDRTPTARNASWTTPEEVSAAVRYLLSKEAGRLSGARIPLHGPA